MRKTDSREKLIELMNKYKNLVFSVCLKLTGDYFTAEDITQETFISAYEHLNEFDGSSEKAWLCRIASNKCIDYLKAAERRTTPTMEEEIIQLKDSTEGPLNLFTTKDVLSQVERKCRELPEGYAEIAKMYFVKGMTAKAISEKEKIPIKTVQTRIYRARDMLRKTVRKEDLLA
ncbi:RNA polymerase sigma factor [Butyrivibrio sp. YAB3001]|uniref:RNA polymerase sigma factor n=1 Tax=Butyrivibrio sp. YAB3001 TaxID=1520812 RepID=UPI0008F62A83|nr:sigma-70 family RNA polymerase sigma factor [Butyrivibrio sp. YAB3001]SFB71773.1 RNA polymerase sigma-70 factor, ECF subfamily [Butyrivibrio sp. YAB3001]